MKNLHKKALDAYLEMLEIHISTKTEDNDFHKATEEFYETLFEVAHKIGEKHIDLWWKLSSSSLDAKKKQASTIIAKLRKEIEKYAEKEDITLGTEDLLGSLANSLENIEGTSKSFLK
jgi:DNA-binding ferritin-like protein